GTVAAFGPVGGGPTYPVAGTVVVQDGRPIASASVTVGLRTAKTDANGSFALSAVNGTYAVTVAANGFVSNTTMLVVAGPTLGLEYVLVPVPLVPVTGRVIDGHTLRPLGNVPVLFFGPFGSFANTSTDPNGSFALLAPVGLDYVTASPPNGYGPYAEHVVVPAAGLSGLEIRLAVTSGALDGRLVWIPLAAIGLALLSIAVWDSTRRRRELGLPPGLLSPFATYVAMRSILLAFQAVAILSVLYIFGTMLPAVAHNVSPCAFIDSGCLAGGWSNPGNIPPAFAYGMGHFVTQLVTGDWGTTTYGHLREPASQFLVWYLPNSIELALFALPIAAVIAYVVGLWAGAHPESLFDGGARIASIAGLLLPSFLIVLLFLGAFYVPFLDRLGDVPYGFLPTQLWYLHHPFPNWIGTGGNTMPTGFPLLDGAIHGNWPFVELVFLKTLWQAFAIALVYVSIYLRFVRHAVAEAFREPIVVAARARGIPESTILWRHTGRRVLPLLVLVFGLTLPLYLGTQALVESLAQDNGIGGLLVSQMTQAVSSGFGFRSLAPGRAPQSFYQVTIFLLVLVVLAGHLVSDVIARYLDPRLLRAPR
ncbi:MAG: ABC transporter permease subunit, partial [Thermoplasmata archaeon]|nr:ABC transporter permease subunit [Thermoplasmata archaeon]